MHSLLIYKCLFLLMVIFNFPIKSYSQNKIKNINIDSVKRKLIGKWEMTNEDKNKIIYIFNDSELIDIFIEKNHVYYSTKTKYSIIKDGKGKFSAIGDYLICLYDDDGKISNAFDIMFLKNGSLGLMDLNVPSVNMYFEKRQNKHKRTYKKQ